MLSMLILNEDIVKDVQFSYFAEMLLLRMSDIIQE